jgi:hypothetical protein
VDSSRLKIWTLTPVRRPGSSFGAELGGMHGASLVQNFKKLRSKLSPKIWILTRAGRSSSNFGVMVGDMDIGMYGFHQLGPKFRRQGKLSLLIQILRVLRTWERSSFHRNDSGVKWMLAPAIRTGTPDNVIGSNNIGVAPAADCAAYDGSVVNVPALVYTIIADKFESHCEGGKELRRIKTGIEMEEFARP